MQDMANTLTERMQGLSPEQLAVVEEFIEQLRSSKEDLALSRAAAQQSEPVFSAIWDNPEDDVYDAL
jgi:hypothetical protein